MNSFNSICLVCAGGVMGCAVGGAIGAVGGTVGAGGAIVAGGVAGAIGVGGTIVAEGGTGALTGRFGRYVVRKIVDVVNFLLIPYKQPDSKASIGDIDFEKIDKSELYPISGNQLYELQLQHGTEWKRGAPEQ